MHEVKKPHKPLIYYYLIVLAVLFLFNLIAMPRLVEQQIVQVDYNDFMSNIEKEQIDKVQYNQQVNEILFTVKSRRLASDSRSVSNFTDTGVCPPPGAYSSVRKGVYSISMSLRYLFFIRAVPMRL